MNITYKNFIPVEDYNRLRAAVGWEKLCDEQARQGLEHSAWVASCYDADKIVGIARILWDRGSIAYLADVIVMPEYQGQGIGRMLVEKAMAFIRSQLKDGWKITVVLLSAKGKEEFYEKFGFRERPNENAGAGMDLWLS